MDTELLRAICKELTLEKGAEKLRDLLSLLCAVVDEDEREVELRARELSERYPSLKEHLLKASGREM